MDLMNCRCCPSLVSYMTNWKRIIAKYTWSWRKSGIRRPNRTERNRLT